MKPDSTKWGRERESDAAVDRLLDAAGRAFAEGGLERTRMEHVARVAACSRGTVYRYFEDREALRKAYVSRETLRIGARIAKRLPTAAGPEEALVEAIVLAVREVRGNAVLRAWFVPATAGATLAMAASSEVIQALASDVLGTIFDVAAARGRLRRDLDRAEATEWVVRVVLSLLSVEITKRSAAREKAYLKRFLVPALFTTVVRRPRGGARRRKPSRIPS